MNVAVKVFKIFAAMSDHRARERGQRFCGNFDRARGEKLVVRKHEENVQRRTPNVQSRMQKRRYRCYESALMKLMSPLRSRRAILIFAKSSVSASSRRSSSRS